MKEGNRAASPSWPRGFTWGVAGLVALCLILFAISWLADEPVRRYIERRVNGNLKGYTLHIGKLDLHPLSLSLDVENVTFIQNRHSDPPMMQVPKWHVSVQWSELFKGSLVSDHVIERPAANITRPQAKAELRDPRPSAWQDTLRQIFPLRINALKVENAKVTYYDHPKARPLELTEVRFEAGNISNRGREQAYSFTIKLDARPFKKGRITAEGTANFLAKPFLGINLDFNVDRVSVEDVMGVAGRYSLLVKNGLLTANGRVEYAPWRQVADIQDMRLEGIKADYVYRQHPNDEARRAEMAQIAAEAKANPLLVVKVKHGKVLGGEFGFVNQSASPDYRVFVGEVNAELDNFSTRLKDLDGGDAVVKVTGKFMGMGRSVIAGTFRPEKPNPDFDLDVRIVKTDLKSFNHVLRAYTDMDVSNGVFSFFSELSIKNGRVQGYLKPIFKNVEVYDSAQDHDKAWSEKAYEVVVGAIVELFKNEERQQVAAQTDVSGALPNSQADTWQNVATAIQNAFFKAILPGLEKEHGKV